jgi:hypothetical protein
VPRSPELRELADRRTQRNAAAMSGTTLSLTSRQRNRNDVLSVLLTILELAIGEPALCK